MHRLLMMSLASLRRGVLCLGLTVLVGTVLTSCRTTPEEIPGREGVPLPEGVEMATLDFSSEVIAGGILNPLEYRRLSRRRISRNRTDGGAGLHQGRSCDRT